MTAFNGLITLEGLVVLIVAAGVCGAIGMAVFGGGRGGIIASMTLGVIGALIGPWVAHGLHVAEPMMLSISGQPFPVLWSVLGAGLLVTILQVSAGWRWSAP